jgi:hypothetical protein
MHLRWYRNSGGPAATSTASKDHCSATDENHFRTGTDASEFRYIRSVSKWSHYSEMWNTRTTRPPRFVPTCCHHHPKEDLPCRPRHHDKRQKKRKRQVVQSEDEEGEYNPSGPNVEVSTPPGWQTSTEKRPVKAQKSKSKPKTSTWPLQQTWKEGPTER